MPLDDRLLEILACPKCKGELEYRAGGGRGSPALSPLPSEVRGGRGDPDHAHRRGEASLTARGRSGSRGRSRGRGRSRDRAGPGVAGGSADGCNGSRAARPSSSRTREARTSSFAPVISARPWTATASRCGSKTGRRRRTPRNRCRGARPGSSACRRRVSRRARPRLARRNPAEARKRRVHPGARIAERPNPAISPLWRLRTGGKRVRARRAASNACSDLPRIPAWRCSRSRWGTGSGMRSPEAVEARGGDPGRARHPGGGPRGAGGLSGRSRDHDRPRRRP